MLDTLGEGTAVNNNNNLMFRFEKLDYGLVGQVQSRHTINSATRGYISLNNHPNISYRTTQMDTYVRVSMFIPYEMIKEIAPNATFDSFDDDLFFTVYGANSSFIENIIYY